MSHPALSGGASAPAKENLTAQLVHDADAESFTQWSTDLPPVSGTDQLQRCMSVAGMYRNNSPEHAAFGAADQQLGHVG